MPPGFPVFLTRLLGRRWLSEKAFEIELSRPAGFDFRSGQRIRLLHGIIERDYTLISAPHDETLAVCIRHLTAGRMSGMLGTIAVGSRLRFSGPCGYFTFRPSSRLAVFVATGTGIAPFVSMTRAGVAHFSLLHGVRLPSELYYQSLFRSTGHPYYPCLSGRIPVSKAPQNSFSGRVTDCLTQHFPKAAYDFYLCGRREMIRDVTLIVDDHFPGSYVYGEIFY